VAPAIVLPATTTGLECLVLFDQRLAAVLRFRDMPREESRPFIAHLKPSHGAGRILLLSSDREDEVRYLAGQVGIGEVHFSKSPEVRVYIEMANSLDAAVSSAVFDALYERAKRARSMFEISREELRRYEAEHGCILSRQAEPV